MREAEPIEPDEFARTDLRTGRPTPERSRQVMERSLLRWFSVSFTPSRAVVAAIAALTLAALVATQLGYTQRLLDAARYRIQMVGVPELTETTIAPQSAAYLSMANWETIPLPAPASQIFDYSADPSDPATLAVCGISSPDMPTIHGDMTQRGPVWIWYTHDAGKTWSRGQWPPMTGTRCWLNRAPDDSHWLTLLIEHPAPTGPRCSEYDLLLSDDSGVTWRPTPMIFSATEDAVQFCSHGSLIVRGRVFLYTSWSTGQAEPEFHTALAHSDDGGRHWSEADGDMAQYLNFRSTLLVDGTLVTVRSAPQQDNPENTSTLWASTDTGDSWRPLSTLQGVVPDEALPSFGAQSAHATTVRPLYLPVTTHIPSRLLRLKAAQIVDDRHWAYLPPLPAPGTSVDHAGITSILGVTGSGKLLAFGVNPQTGIQTDKPLEEQFDRQWLWSWDAQASRWTSLAPPLPVAWMSCSDGCWQASFSRDAAGQHTVLWTRGFVSENHTNDALYRLSLPAEVA
jgi:hypothetical protein